MKRWMFALIMTLLCSRSAFAQSVDTPMDFTKKFNGDQNLRFTAGGKPLQTKGTRLNYRVIRNAADWKKVWGYLYDDTVKVDFKNQVVIVIYKSPANGSFDFVPKRVFHFQDNLKMDVDVVWNGKTGRSHPFLFLVVKPFKNLNVSENFVSPRGKEMRYP